jgi:alkyl sulfatase BDS1-like metallo-beta-lactamase superfamily hydrolase
MPDADKFSRYIRDSANELEEIILEKGKQKTSAKAEGLKSTLFFSELKKYLNKDQKTRNQHIGLYDFQLNLAGITVNYQLEILEESVSVRKKKTTKPLVQIQIDDDNLNSLYKKKLLLDEIIIQGRIKLVGTKKNSDKLLKLLVKFIEND